MKKRVKDYNIILYDYFAKIFGERIASIIIIPSAIIIWLGSSVGRAED